MAQVTRDMCERIIAAAARHEYFPLTPNEMRQLAYLAIQTIASAATVGEREADIEKAFQLIFEGYGKPRDTFGDDHGYIVFLRDKLTKAFGLLQRVTGRASWKPYGAQQQAEPGADELECNGSHDYGEVKDGAKECTVCTGEAGICERTKFEAWLAAHPYPITWRERGAFFAGYRAAQSGQRAGVAEDAARYRWLRERRFYKADNPHTSMYHKGGCDTGWLYLKTLDRDGLDAAIDAAISAAATQQQQEG